MSNWAKCVKYADDADEMQTAQEKRAGGKTGGELSPVDPSELNLLNGREKIRSSQRASYWTTFNKLYILM